MFDLRYKFWRTVALTRASTWCETLKTFSCHEICILSVCFRWIIKVKPYPVKCHLQITAGKSMVRCGRVSHWDSGVYFRLNVPYKQDGWGNRKCAMAVQSFFLSISRRARSSSFLWLRGEVAVPFPYGGDEARGATLGSRLYHPYHHVNEVKWWIAEPNYRGKMNEDQIEESTKKPTARTSWTFFEN